MDSLAIRADGLEVQDLDRARFVALAPEWPELQARTGHLGPFHRHEFLRLWLESFAPEAPVHALVARDARGLRAALVLVESRERRVGLTVIKLAGAANVHSGRFDLLAAPDDIEAIAALWTHLRDRLEWDVLELPDVPEAGSARALLKLAAEEGRPTGEWESMRTPYIPLGAPLEEVLARSTNAKFRSNLRRRRKKLLEQGAVTLERISGDADLAAKLEEGLALEASGWKGREGTAMAQDPATRGFYEGLACEAASQGYLSIFFLRVGGRAAAFHFGLTCEGRYYLPKLGIEEALGACSPGQLIVEDVLGDCCARGLAEFDFLGPNMPWKQDWTDRVRVHHWLYIYSGGALGRGLHAAKFKLAPKVKEVLPWKH
jgi:CelD/BcsL family acetyltransferase involved in cellulose biosynthesis